MHFFYIDQFQFSHWAGDAGPCPAIMYPVARALVRACGLRGWTRTPSRAARLHPRCAGPAPSQTTCRSSSARSLSSGQLAAAAAGRLPSAGGAYPELLGPGRHLGGASGD